ncbi:MAG: Ni/Fe-hydrogenase, b-type cytochrome subunit [Nevskiaceae bacterium]|jgi:Ni/Fe-hydrogenase 1 B-type cytochrome subunit|nr:Ni/Fe-hydrogenase, b-type cytochrome subunit [Nevskiaceae bacterium]
MSAASTTQTLTAQELAQRRLASITGVDASGVRRAQNIKAIYVYEVPVRIWHWINVAAILTLCITGYFIGKPPPTMPGEASANYLMGYIRFAHFASGYILAVGLLGRAYWALVGNHHARELFSVPIFQKAYWREALNMVRWYMFLIPKPNQYVGHNPLARLVMFSGFLLTATYMIITGLALYGEGAQMGSWQERMFGWVIVLFGTSQDLHTWHRLGMWAMVIFITVHVYAAIREDIMGRQSMVSTMISGHRTFK